MNCDSVHVSRNLLIATVLLSSMAAIRAEEPISLPKVLILGDSISIAYTPIVREMLNSEAIILRPTRNEKPENCQGTTNGVKNIDRWLAIDGGDWDLIHFNFGLHDIKHVDPETRQNSNDPNHPPQADLQTYDKQLQDIVAKLKATGATLIFATTTPFPPGTRPFRDAEDVDRYNAIARRIMKENKIAVNDLHGFTKPRLKEIQIPVNVHFTPDGSKTLAAQVANSMRRELRRPHAASVNATTEK